jgi:hypothetical protein
MAVCQIADEDQPQPASRARRCFIAAHPKANLETIRALLAERGIEATASYERPWIGARPFDTVMALIDQADLVVGVLDDSRTNANLLIELGYAIARDKKIMVILPRDGATVPSDLVSTLYARANPTDADAIVYNLDALLAAPTPNRRPHIPDKPETHPIGPKKADELLQRLSISLDSSDEVALAGIVGDSLRASGVSIVESAHPDSGFDFGIWSDDLESSVGNPLLIEVKSHMQSAAQARKVRERVEAYVHARNVAWGLVLYGDGPPPDVGDLHSTPPTLLLKISDLIERLRVEGFASTVSRLYDEAIRSG